MAGIGFELRSYLGDRSYTGLVKAFCLAGAIGSGPWLISIMSMLLIGLLMPLLTERFIVNPHWRLLLVVGFLGAYTTFSTFEYETGALLKDGELLFAGLNIVLSVVVGFVALKLGEMLAKML